MKLVIGLLIGLSLGMIGTLSADPWEFQPRNPAQEWQRDYDQKLHRSTELQFQHFLQQQPMRPPC
jgi:hypothetical protein